MQKLFLFCFCLYLAKEKQYIFLLKETKAEEKKQTKTRKCEIHEHCFPRNPQKNSVIRFESRKKQKG